jgi:integrase
VFARKLSARSRALLDEALTTGYLREYEVQRRTGMLLDYHIFPQGALVETDKDLPPALVPRTGGSLPFSPKDANVLTIDPRLKLVLDIGAALRLGQVARLTRRAVDLSKLQETDPVTGRTTVIGFAGVKGRGNKKSPGAALNAEQLASVRDALEGFLAPLEARFQAGEIADYPMCPGGALKRGAVSLRNPSAMKPATNSAMHKWFKKLEQAAGVTTIPFRGWYGVRRLFTDEATRLSANTMVLEQVSGTSSRMLAEVYRDGESARVSVEASQVVGQLRTAGRRGASPVAAAPSVIALDPQLLKALAGRTVDEVRAALDYLHAQRAAASGTKPEPKLEPKENRPTPSAESGGPSPSSSTT